MRDSTGNPRATSQKLIASPSTPNRRPMVWRGILQVRSMLVCRCGFVGEVLEVEDRIEH
jgi:hypothetical protein